MKYSLYRIRKLLWNNRKMYGFATVEMAIGILILVSCLNITFTNRDALRSYRQDMAKNNIPVQWTSNIVGEMGEQSPGLRVDYKEYLRLQKEYKDTLIFFYAGIIQDILFMGWESEEEIYISNIYFLFMNDNMFEKTFEFKRENNEVYAGNIAYQDLLKMNQATEDEVVQINGFEVKENKIWFSEKQGVNFKEIPEGETVGFIDRTSIKTEDAQKDGLRIDIQNCVICPVEMLAEFNSAEVGLDVILTLQHLSEEFSANTIPRLLNELVERNGGRYNFSIEDKYLTMEKRSQEQDNLVRMFFAVSVILLMIVMIGMIGTLLILFQKRKKEIAITIAFGATMRRNLLEVFGEVVIVFFSGGIVGLLLADIICGYNLNMIDITFYPVCILFVLLFCVFTALFCCMAVLVGVDIEKPVKVLKEL